MTVDPSLWIGQTPDVALLLAAVNLLTGGSTVLTSFATLATLAVAHGSPATADVTASYTLNGSFYSALVR